jgi:L-lactate dehydrogenase complex protein LldG
VNQGSRATILDRIRRVSADPASRADDYGRIRREYRHSGGLDASGRLSLFLDRLKDYGANTPLSRADSVAETIATALSARSLPGLVVPAGFPQHWIPEGFAFVQDDALSYQEIDACCGVLTTCAVAIASTGTVVLQDQAPGQGRRALSLIPDYHLCVVCESQILETVPEALGSLEKTRTIAITTISGPSATSDIEMTRIKGVHGPRTLDVIVVLEDAAG